MKNFKLLKPILKKAIKGNRGYPLATLAFYGPTNKLATKVVLGIFQYENDDPVLIKWYSQKIDIRTKPEIIDQIVTNLKDKKILSLLLKDTIYGCPHEEGIDYPTGDICKECSYWENKER